jgi:hypothetical protein
MSVKNILSLLEGGDRRSIGRADEVAKIVSANPKLFPQLVRGLWSEDARVRMRAADAMEKVTRSAPKLLQRHKCELLGLMGETTEQEVRWHLAAMVPRLSLAATERVRAVTAFNKYLEDRSSIVKTFALRGLADLAGEDESLHGEVIEALREAVRGGTPAMKARGKKLLVALEKS